MNNANNNLYAKNSGSLQIPYQDYKELMERIEEANRIKQVKTSVLEDLMTCLGEGVSASDVQKAASDIEVEEVPDVQKPASDIEVEEVPDVQVAEIPAQEKVSIEFTAEDAEPVEENLLVVADDVPAHDAADVPPIKKDIARHFNKMDESGRLFNVFSQYYACLNDACGGTVCVTMKDGFCSLWNYDAWEEFAFIDMFEGQLRIAIDPRYTDELKSLSLCEVPRLLSTRANFICVRVDDLNNLVLGVLVRAFNEVDCNKTK